jgi:hypothetical protein
MNQPIQTYVIEDEWHAEPQEGEFTTFAEALAELESRAQRAWTEAPNRAPCEEWQTCGRNYEIVQYDSSVQPWSELRRIPALQVTSAGARWLLDRRNSPS